MLTSNSSQLLLERQNMNKHRVNKNRLLLVSILNISVFICAIFSMAYFQWIQISFAVYTRQPNQDSVIVTIWSNLLYASFGQSYYISYEQMQLLICPPDDTFCLAILYEMDFVGKICFFIILSAFVISCYDFYLIIRFAFSQLTTKSKYFIETASAAHFKNNFRSFLMVTIYVIGLSLDFFAMTLISLEHYSYGVSFWLFCSSLILFVLISLWQNRKMSKISKQELVIKLLEKQKQMLRDSKGSDSSLSIHSSSDVFSL